MTTEHLLCRLQRTAAIALTGAILGSAAMAQGSMERMGFFLCEIDSGESIGIAFGRLSDGRDIAIFGADGVMGGSALVEEHGSTRRLLTVELEPGFLPITMMSLFADGALLASIASDQNPGTSVTVAGQCIDAEAE
jgi:hypothetical protein